MVIVTAIAVISLIASESFLNPTDATVYLAAGERLNAGHELYALQPGDRPILLTPPYWTVPTLSPPLLGVAWRPLALFGTTGIWLGWALTGLIYLGALIVLVRFIPIWGAIAAAGIAPNIGHQLAIGNVNGLLALGVLGMWCLRDRAWLIGGILAVMVLVKVTPIVLALWLLATGRHQALVAAAACGVALTAIAALGAGWSAHLQYLDVATDTVSVGTTDASISGVLRQIGVNESLARFAPWMFLAGGATLIARWRHDDGRAFALAVVLMTIASPAFNPYWLALTLFALVPFALPAQRRNAVPPALGARS